VKKPIVWTIAGSDPGGAAGIQADIKTFQALGVHGCSVVTALTAQNSYQCLEVALSSVAMVEKQMDVLKNDLQAKAIKLGMLGSIEVMQAVSSFIKTYDGYIVCDPVMISSSGGLLMQENAKSYFIKEIIPHVDVLTPNLDEVKYLLNRDFNIEDAAHELLNLGAKNVFIKGGHGTGNFCQDYWSNGEKSAWLTMERRSNLNNHGSGCTLSAAITAAIALNYDLLDALVIAKAYVSQGIRTAHQYGRGPGPIAHGSWPMLQEDLPWMTTTAEEGIHRPLFKRCTVDDLGFYLVVDSLAWLEKLLPVGVKTVQLRIKNKQGKALEEEIKNSILLAKKYNAKLFINDYWELALAHQAYGVHLGQEDISSADFEKLEKSGIRLGISTHCYYEVARAHALQPSYIACGPVFPTTSKIMPFAPQGIKNLRYWRALLDYPLVAIGGITLDNLTDVLACNVEGIALISAVLHDPYPEQAAQNFLKMCERHTKECI